MSCFSILTPKNKKKACPRQEDHLPGEIKFPAPKSKVLELFTDILEKMSDYLLVLFSKAVEPLSLKFSIREKKKKDTCQGKFLFQKLHLINL